MKNISMTLQVKKHMENKSQNGLVIDLKLTKLYKNFLKNIINIYNTFDASKQISSENCSITIYFTFIQFKFFPTDIIL